MKENCSFKQEISSEYRSNGQRHASSFSIMAGMMRTFMQVFSSSEGFRLSFLSDGNMLSSTEFCGGEGGVYDGSDQGGAR